MISFNTLKAFFRALTLLLSLTCRHVYADCWDYAEQQFGIDGDLLAAIAAVESGMNTSAVNANKNGSADYGLMQINSRHLARLSLIGVDKNLLRTDPCVSVLVGASILSDMIKVYGFTWEAVGAYNAGTGKSRHQQRMKYARKVQVLYGKKLRK